MRRCILRGLCGLVEKFTGVTASCELATLKRLVAVELGLSSGSELSKQATREGGELAVGPEEPTGGNTPLVVDPMPP
jgi:hypothetical protein